MTKEELIESIVQSEKKRMKEGYEHWKEKNYDENGFYDPQEPDKANQMGSSPPVLPVGKLRFDLKTETVSSVAAMQMRAGALFSEMIQGKIAGYRVEMDRTTHPATFHITTWR